MHLIGLTGGIGAGKTAATRLLESWNVSCIDTDQLAREVVQTGEPAVAEIVEAFGEFCLKGDGTLDRRAVAKVVFGDPRKRKELESIVHPRIRKRWKSRVEEWRAKQFERGCVIIPLLFETHAENEFDQVICIGCGKAAQDQRLKQRGWTAEEIDRRLQAQMPMREKMERADIVIWNDGSLELLEDQLRVVLGL